MQRLAGSAAPTPPKLAGVRYALIIDLGTDTVHAAGRVRAQAALPASVRERSVGEPARGPAAFEQAFADPAFAAAPVSGPASPLAALTRSAPGIDAQPAAAARRGAQTGASIEPFSATMGGVDPARGRAGHNRENHQAEVEQVEAVIQLPHHHQRDGHQSGEGRCQTGDEKQVVTAVLFGDLLRHAAAPVRLQPRLRASLANR